MAEETVRRVLKRFHLLTSLSVKINLLSIECVNKIDFQNVLCRWVDKLCKGKSRLRFIQALKNTDEREGKMSFNTKTNLLNCIYSLCNLI